MQSRPGDGACPTGDQGEQGPLPQGEAPAQREDQQRDPGARPVAARPAAGPHLHQRLPQHERLPQEEGAVDLEINWDHDGLI